MLLTLGAPVLDVLARGDTAGDEAASHPAAAQAADTRNQPCQDSDDRLRQGHDFLMAGRALHRLWMG